MLYLNFWDKPQDSPYLVVRAAENGAEHLAANVRAAVQEARQHFPLWIRTIANHRDIALVQERLLGRTSTTFAGLGLLIAAVGLFGLLNHYVASRHKEIGIRTAVGATGLQIARLLIRDMAPVFVAGVVSGALLLFAALRVLDYLAVAITPAGPVLTLAVVAVMAGAVLVSLLVPLRRALAIDPAIVLRSE